MAGTKDDVEGAHGELGWGGRRPASGVREEEDGGREKEPEAGEWGRADEERRRTVTDEVARAARGGRRRARASRGGAAELGSLAALLLQWPPVCRGLSHAPGIYTPHPPLVAVHGSGRDKKGH